MTLFLTNILIRTVIFSFNCADITRCFEKLNPVIPVPSAESTPALSASLSLWRDHRRSSVYVQSLGTTQGVQGALLEARMCQAALLACLSHE